MKTYKKLMIALSILIALGIAGTAMAITYHQKTVITDVTITSHIDNDTVFAGGTFTFACEASIDKDCHRDGGRWVEDDDLVTHSWSQDRGQGFTPDTGTSNIVWKAPTTTGDANVTITADDDYDDPYDPYLWDDTEKSDTVTIDVTNIIYVDASVSGGKDDGSSWTNAFDTIQEGIDAAEDANVPDNKIWVAEGTYVLSSGMSINKAISIYGGFDGTEEIFEDRDAFPGNTHTTTVNGNNVVGMICFNITDVATIDGFTITNASYTSSTYGIGIACYDGSSTTTITNCNITNSGYGIYCSFSSSPTISNCIFSGNGENDDGWGMGIFSSSSPTITNCEFNQNPGGGIYFNSSSGTISISGCEFTSNGADRSLGGAIYCNNSSPTIEDCEFTNNTAGYDGGGAIYCNGGSTTISDCVFTGNESDSASGPGGAIVCGDSTTIEDCEFTNNTAGNSGGGAISCNGSTISGCVFTGNGADGTFGHGEGGAIVCYGSPTIEDCEFIDNTAEWYGGAIFCFTSSSASPKIERCVFSGNTAGQDGGGLFALYSTPEVINCLFINNEAHNGGGIATDKSNGSSVINCTFYGNASLGTYNDDGGGAVYAEAGLGSYCSTTMTNCILWENTAANDGHEVCCNGYSITYKARVTLEYCDIQDTTDWGFEVNAYSVVDYLYNDNIYDDPDFLSPGTPKGTDGEWPTSDDGFTLKYTSDCINEGDDVTNSPDYISEDITGTGSSRKISVYVDIGAYEYGN